MFFFYWAADHRNLPAFPTRLSSNLRLTCRFPFHAPIANFYFRLKKIIKKKERKRQKGKMGNGSLFYTFIAINFAKWALYIYLFIFFWVHYISTGGWESKGTKVWSNPSYLKIMGILRWRRCSFGSVGRNSSWSMTQSMSTTNGASVIFLVYHI